MKFEILCLWTNIVIILQTSPGPPLFPADFCSQHCGSIEIQEFAQSRNQVLCLSYNNYLIRLLEADPR